MSEERDGYGLETEPPKTLADVQALYERMKLDPKTYCVSYLSGFGYALDLCEQVAARVPEPKPGGLVEALLAKAENARSYKTGIDSVSNVYELEAVCFEELAKIAAVHESRWQADRARLEQTVDMYMAESRRLHSERDALQDEIRAERARWQKAYTDAVAKIDAILDAQE